MHHEWRAGMARTTFPIEPGTPLGGYIAREHPATGTLDPLQIDVLLLDDGAHQMLIIGADVIAVDGDLVHQIASRAGIAEDHVLLGASHTHAGPRGIVERLHPSAAREADTALRERFVHTTVELVTEARKALEPVTLGVATGDATGAWTNRNDPTGRADLRVRVLTVRDGADQLLGAVVLFSCHPTVLAADNLLVSADLAGGIRRAIAVRIGTGPVLLTLTGAAGDTSTRSTRRGATPEEIDRLGGIAGEAALAAMARTTPVSPGIRSAVEHVTLPPVDLKDRDLAAEVTLAHMRLRELETRGAPAEEIRTATTQAQGALLRSRLAELPSVEIAIPAWRLGEELALAGIPGELFASLGAGIEAAVRGEAWIVGYANGYAGYIPDRAAYAAGTYEALASPFGEDVGDVVVEGAIRALRQITP